MDKKKSTNTEFIKKIREEIMLADGAMGTYLLSKEIPSYTCLENLNLIRPKLVKDVHLEYINAGASIIETNTYNANYFKLKKYDLQDKVVKINKAGALIAREAAEKGKEKIFVAGCLGTLGKGIMPYGAIDPKEAKKVFNEQITGLLEGGVDCLIIETIATLAEAKIALIAASELTDLPLICQLTYLGTNYPVSELVKNFKELIDLGADVVGLNCSLGPAEMYKIMSEVRVYIKSPCSVFPNAGYPTIVNDKIFYLSSPGYFSEYAKKFVEIGCNIIGGCCGTTPEHIKSMKKVVEGKKPGAVKKTAVVGKKEKPIIDMECSKINFLEKLKKEFTVTVEIDPPYNGDYGKILEKCARLKECGIDVLDIADNPLAKPRMSALVLAHIIKEKLGMNVLLHFTCRDRNLIRIQSDLLGAAALNIDGIIALTGDPPTMSNSARVSGVFDLDSIELVRLIANLNQGRDYQGNFIGEVKPFGIGTALNLGAEDNEKERAKFNKKIEAGAHFALTQPVYDVRYIDKIESFPMPVLIGLLPLHSYKQARFLNDEVPGINIPPAIMARMEKTVDGRKEGLEITKEFLDKVVNKIKGIYIMPSAGDFTIVEEIMVFLKQKKVK